MKKLLTIMLIFALAAFCSACIKAEEPVSDITPDPVTEEDLVGTPATNFIDAPEEIGTFVQTGETTLDDGTMQVTYESEEGQSLILRKAFGANKDISGIEDVYDNAVTFTNGDVTATTRTRNGLGYVTTWSSGDYSYSISCEQGYSVAIAEIFVENVI